MAENVRRALVAGGDPTLIERAAKLLGNHLRENGGRIRSRDLPSVDPSFEGLGVGLAEATGLLEAAKAGRRRHAGHDVVAFRALGDAEAVAGLEPAPRKREPSRPAKRAAPPEPVPTTPARNPPQQRAAAPRTEPRQKQASRKPPRTEPPFVALAAARGDAYERRLLAVSAGVEAAVRASGGIEAGFLEAVLAGSDPCEVRDAVRMLARKGVARVLGSPRCVFPAAPPGVAGASADIPAATARLFSHAGSVLAALAGTGAVGRRSEPAVRREAGLTPAAFRDALAALVRLRLVDREGEAFGVSRRGLAAARRLAGTDARTPEPPAWPDATAVPILLVAAELGDFIMPDLEASARRALGYGKRRDLSAPVLDLELRGFLSRRRVSGWTRYAITEAGNRAADELAPEAFESLAAAVHGFPPEGRHGTAGAPRR